MYKIWSRKKKSQSKKKKIEGEKKFEVEKKNSKSKKIEVETSSRRWPAVPSACGLILRSLAERWFNVSEFFSSLVKLLEDVGVASFDNT